MGKDFSPYVKAVVKEGTFESVDITNQNPSWAWAAGNVISTANDLAIWIKSLIDGQLINAEYQNQWLNNMMPQDSNDPSSQLYGHGIADLVYQGHRMYLHTGQIPGYNSAMLYDPINQITIVAWTNLALSVSGVLPVEVIMNAVIEEVYR